MSTFFAKLISACLVFIVGKMFVWWGKCVGKVWIRKMPAERTVGIGESGWVSVISVKPVTYVGIP